MVSNFVHLRSQPSCRLRQLYVWDNFTSDFSVFDLLELIVRKHAFTLTVIQSQTNSNWCYDSGTAVKLTIETRLLTIFRQNRQVDGFVKFLFLSIHLGLLNRFMWLVSVLFIRYPSILHFPVRSTFVMSIGPRGLLRLYRLIPGLPSQRGHPSVPCRPPGQPICKATRPEKKQEALKALKHLRCTKGCWCSFFAEPVIS